MSAIRFREDLTEPGVMDEPRAASNAGMNLALILTVVLSLAFVIWAVVASPGTNYSMNPKPADTRTAPPGAISTPHTTVSNNKAISTENDKSYASGFEVQSPAPGSTARNAGN